MSFLIRNLQAYLFLLILVFQSRITPKYLYLLIPCHECKHLLQLCMFFLTLFLKSSYYPLSSTLHCFLKNKTQISYCPLTSRWWIQSIGPHPHAKFDISLFIHFTAIIMSHQNFICRSILWVLFFYIYQNIFLNLVEVNGM